MIWFEIGLLFLLGSVFIWAFYFRPKRKLDGKRRRFFEEMDDFMRRHGRYQSVLESQALDEEFGVLSLEFCYRSFNNGQKPAVVAALLMDASHKHHANRQFGIEFMRALCNKSAA